MKTFVALFAFVALLGVAAAQSARKFQHPLTNVPPAHEDVRTAYRFVDEAHATSLPLGAPITVLCPFYNGGEQALNVSMIMGSLNNPYQFNHFLKNFSARPVNTSVAPGQEVTFQYRLYIDAQQLDTVNYQLAFTVFYDDGVAPYASTFFNESRPFFYAPQEFDFKSLAGYIVFAAIVAVVVKVVRSGDSASSAISSSSRASTSASADADASDDFSSGRDHMPKANSSSRRRKRQNK